MLGHQFKDENFYFPPIPAQMTQAEFDLLSQDSGLKEMLYAAVVPGYMHFVAQEETVGYVLLGTRLASYTTMIASYAIASNELSQLSGSTKVAFDVALLVAVGSYLFDYIAGEYTLNAKQNALRYHYGKTASTLSFDGNRLSFSHTF